MTIGWQHLVGVPFLWGKDDCFGLVRRFYADNFDIQITNYARPTNWSAGVVDLPRICHAREGFDMLTDWRVAELRPGDLLMMAVGDTAANHFAIYVGDNTILHHLYGRPSSEEPFRGFWRNSICYVLRNPNVPDLRPVYPSTDIGSLLRARYNLIPDA